MNTRNFSFTGDIMPIEEKLQHAFKDKASELLAELENSLLELERRPDDMELIGRIFRAMHTIKGSGAMFGFENITQLTHEAETVFDMVRNGELTVTRDLIDLTLAVHDHIHSMLDVPDNGDFMRRQKTGGIITSLRNIAGAAQKLIMKRHDQDRRPS